MCVQLLRGEEEGERASVPRAGSSAWHKVGAALERVIFSRRRGWREGRIGVIGGGFESSAVIITGRRCRSQAGGWRRVSIFAQLLVAGWERGLVAGR